MHVNQRRRHTINIYANETFNIPLTLPVPDGATTYTTWADAIVMIESLLWAKGCEHQTCNWPNEWKISEMGHSCWWWGRWIYSTNKMKVLFLLVYRVYPISFRGQRDLTKGRLFRFYYLFGGLWAKGCSTVSAPTTRGTKMNGWEAFILRRITKKSFWMWYRCGYQDCEGKSYHFFSDAGWCQRSWASACIWKKDPLLFNIRWYRGSFAFWDVSIGEIFS